METTRTNVFKQIIDFFNSFRENPDSSEIDYEKELSEDDRKLLEEMRKIDKVEKIEEITDIRKKYGAKVNTNKAKASASKNKTGKKASEKIVSKE